jgi:cysteine-rich repeat protein
MTTCAGRFLSALVVLSVAAAPAGGDVGPAGPEFLVNTYTTNVQRSADLCATAGGDFVVVWRSLEGDGSNYAVRGQRFARDGAPRGTEFQVNTYTTGAQYNGGVCCTPAGDFVVAGHSPYLDGSSAAVFARRYASDGTALGTEFVVNGYTTSFQRAAHVCCEADGGFVVGWESSGQDGSDTAAIARRYASDGTPRGDEFRVNQYTTGFQANVKVGCQPDGGFAVTWRSPQDGSADGIYARRYASDGGAAGSEFRVNAYTTGEQDANDVCVLPDGGFVVAWQSYGQDGSNEALLARRFASDGAPSGDDFRVNVHTTAAQSSPHVACDGADRFVVVWESDLQDGSSTGIFGRRFDGTGTALGTEFRVNVYTTSNQVLPGIAADRDGDFVVAWSSDQDGAVLGIVAQRFADPCGDGTVGAGEQCDDGSRLDGVCCSATCQSAVAGTACNDDGVACTADACAGDGTCGHTPQLAACPVCQVCDAATGCVGRPRPDCRRPTRRGAARLELTNKPRAGRDRLRFEWLRGAATTLDEFGTPTSAGNDPTLCVYDGAGGVDRMVFQAAAVGGSGWRTRKGRFHYRSRGGLPGGITKAELRPGRAGKARIVVEGKGAALSLPTLPLTAPVTAQLETAGGCFAAGFASPKRSTGSVFRARGE